MVENNRIHAALLEVRNLVSGTGAAVDCHEQPRLMFLETTGDPVFAEAVAFVHAVRQEIAHVGTRRPKNALQQGARGHAVHVIIAIDDDALVMVDGGKDAIDRRTHARQLERVAELAKLRVEETSRFGGIGIPAVDEDLGQCGRDTQRLGQRLHPRWFGVGNHPALR